MKSTVLVVLIFTLCFLTQRAYAQRSLPFRIAPYEKNDYKSCLERGGKNCRLDTFEYKGWSVDFSMLGSTSIGDYRKAGRKGGGFGMGMGWEYQPINSFPLTIRADFNGLYHDIVNYKAAIPVLLYAPAGNATLYMPVQVNIKSGLYNMNIGARLWLPTKYIQPYAMAMIGFVSQSTEVSIYENDKILYAGISDKGLLYVYSIDGMTAGSSLLAGGLSYNAGYSVNLDLRFSWLYSKRFNQISSADISQWNYNFDGSENEFNPDKFQGSNLTIKSNPVRTSFNILLISLGVTLFFE